MLKAKINLLILFLVVFLIVSFFGTPIWGQEIVWRMGGHHGVEAPETVATNYFVKLVQERTNGRMKIDFYPAEQLGASAVQLDNMTLGIQDANLNTLAWLREINFEYNIFDVPYLFSGIDHVKKFLETDLYQQVEEKVLKEAGIRVLAKNYFRDARVLLLTKPASSLEDIKGRVLRMSASIPYIKTWEALGASCTQIAWGESYSALDTGVVEGVDSPLGTIYGMGFHRVAPYILLTNHVQGTPLGLFVSEKSWQVLPQDIQTIVEEAAKEAGDYYYDLILSSQNENIEKMKKEGAKLIEVDISPALEAMKGVSIDLEEGGYIPKGFYEFIEGIR